MAELSLKELREIATKASTCGRWSPGHLINDDIACNCAYVFDEVHPGAVATVHVNNGLSLADGGNAAPDLEIAKANLRFMATFDPARILGLINEVERLTSLGRPAES